MALDKHNAQCGWCGAVTDFEQLNRHRQRQQSLGLPAGARWRRGCGSWGGRTLVALVVCIVSSMTAAGLVFLLPQLCGPHPLLWTAHLCTGALLAFQVAYNYAAAVRLAPGSPVACVSVPRPDPRTADAEGRCRVPQASLDSWHYCYACCGPKPPYAHHCSTCATCVVDLDHHCPFINNCVGRANRRNFLLFLLWACAGAVHVLLLSAAVMAAGGYSLRGHLTRVAQQLGGAQSPAELLQLVIVGLLASGSPRGVVAATYMWVCALGVLMGVGVLASAQILYVWQGTTYLEQLQQSGGGGGSSGGGGGDGGGRGRERALAAASGDGQQQQSPSPRAAEAGRASGSASPVAAARAASPGGAGIVGSLLSRLRRLRGFGGRRGAGGLARPPPPPQAGDHEASDDAAAGISQQLHQQAGFQNFARLLGTDNVFKALLVPAWGPAPGTYIQQVSSNPKSD